MVRPNPSKIVDRDAEAEVFSRMLHFDSPRRVLVVSDQSGRGKTDLLRKLRYQCEWVHEIPASLFNFETKKVVETFDVVEWFGEEVQGGGAGLRLDNFNQLNQARSFKDTAAFITSFQSVRGSVNLQGAHVGSSDVAGFMIKVEHAERISLPEWTDEMERAARRLCEEAFFSDLMSYAAANPVVLLLDTVNAADEDMQRWLLRDLLRRRVLTAWADHRLIIVLAGTHLDHMLSPLITAQRQCLEPIASLSRWEDHHVREFLEVHGYTALSDADVADIHRIIQRGRSLTQALAFAEILKEPA